jgi:hypothetical protein
MEIFHFKKVYPDMVYTDNEDMKSIFYTELIPVLISAVKEQQDLIEELQKKVELLEKKN